LEKKYDIVIVGGGPCGLTLAQCLSKLNKKILIIDKEVSLGGCHRVKRVQYGDEMLFSEHGPRIYNSTYVNTIMVLKKMNINFLDVFSLYDFDFSKIGNETIFTVLTFRELLIFGFHYILLVLNSNHGKNISMKDFMESNNFTRETMDMVDRLCRLTDGADFTKYTLNHFFNLTNQYFFYKFYQPKLPNDEGLFKYWEEYLINNNVDIMLNTEVKNLEYNQKSNIIESITVRNGFKKYKINCDEIVLAIPPISILKIFENNNDMNILNSFGPYSELKLWSEETKYIEYISLTFHWDKKLELPKIYGFSKTSWALIFIVLSNSMSFKENSSKTVISVAISNGDLKSDRIKKTANECFDKNELIDEIFYQLSQSFPNGLEKYTAAIISPNVIYDKNRWVNLDTAYKSSSINQKTLSFKSNISNMYTVGTHTGKSFFKVTSMESAITNTLHLVHEMYPELKTEFPISRGWELNNLLKLIIVIIIIISVYFFLN
jgi:uncharacterized protein YrzB (UPF0473 family)